MKRWIVQRAVIRVIGLMLPRHLRARWIEEWQSELWYARETRRGPRLMSVRGAIADAWATRRLRGAKRRSPRRLAALSDSIVYDLRYAIRSLFRKPAFAILSIATLSVGIGANSAMFSVVKQILLDPLPYPDAEQLVRIYERRPHQGRERNPASFPDFADWNERSTAFQTMAAYRWTTANFTEDIPEEILGAEVTADFFAVFQALPLAGRLFTPSDDIPGSSPTVILGYGLWQRMFGSRDDLIGSTIRLDGASRTVIGIMPATFGFPAEAEFWVPLGGDRVQWSRNAHSLDVVARLQAGVTLIRARDEMDVIARALESEYPEGNTGHYTNVFPLHSELSGDVRPALLVLFAAVGLVLLIVCVNLANMQLARGTSRGRELAIRASLGANRRRLVRQLLTESAVLALVAGVVGIAFAAAGVYALAGIISREASWAGVIALELPTLSFALVVSGATALIFGLMPALQFSNAQSRHALRDFGGSGTRGQQRVRRALVVTEVALATLLLSGSGLLTRSFVRLTSVDPGIDPDNVLTVGVTLPTASYPDAAGRLRFFDALEERLRALPPVTAAGFTWLLPFSGNESGRNFLIEDRPTPAQGDEWNARFRIADAGYFEVMGIGLLRGRMFAPSDDADSPSVALISRRMHELFWPHEDPIGKRFRLDDDEPWITIIGVVTDVRHQGLDTAPNPEFYLHRRELPARFGTVVVRTSGDPAAVAPMVREEVFALDVNQPVSDVATMREWLSATVAQPKLIAIAATGFSAVAVLLAALGIYGVISYSVGQRRREIGIRIALGGRAGDVLRMIMRQGLMLAAVGFALGIAGALMLGRGLSGILFGVAPTDLAAFSGAAFILGACATVASLVPARRATRVDPLETLRSE